MSGWAEVDKPRGSLIFLSLEDGETKRIRILDEEPYTAYVHKISQMVDNEDVFLTVPATEAPDDDFINANTKRYPTTAVHCLRVAVYDEKGEVEGVKVLQGGIQIFRPLKQFWSRYGDIRKFDVEITRNGTKRDTEYQVTLAPDSNDIDLDEWTEHAQTDESLDWGVLFPPITPEDQQKMLERAKIDITYDPAEEIAAEMEVDEALSMYCTLNKYGPKAYPPKGKTIGEILVIDAGYVEWIAENVTSDDTLAAAARVAVRHMNGELESGGSKKQLPKPSPARKTATPPKAPAKSAGTKGKATEAQDDTGEEGQQPEWTLRMSPEEYLEKFPKGPKAALARQLSGAEEPAPARPAPARSTPAKQAKPAGKSGERDSLISRANAAFESNPEYAEASDIVEVIKKHGNGKTRIKDLTDAQLEALVEEVEG